MDVKIKRRKNNPFDVNALRRVVDEAQRVYSTDVVGMYEDTVSTWEDPPQFGPEYTEYSDRRRVLNIYIRGGGRRIYMWLETGFTRKVPMVPGYKTKTSPGIIGSRPGGGIVGRGRLKTPVPVPARRFTEMIAQAMRSGMVEHGPFPDYVRKQISRYING